MEHVISLILIHATLNTWEYPLPGCDDDNATKLILLSEDSDGLLEFDAWQPVSNSSDLSHLANFQDFKGWNKDAVHEFEIADEVDDEANTYWDQIAVETKLNDDTTQLINSEIIAANSSNSHSLDKPGSDRVSQSNAEESAHTAKNENKDPEAEDDTIRLVSQNVDKTQRILGQNAPVAIKDTEQNSVILSKEENKEKLLKDLQKQYEKDPSIISAYLEVPVKDVELPLITVSKNDPFSITLLVRPKSYDVYTMVRLMYERVPVSKDALPQNLDDPVIEYVPLYRGDQEHRLYNLPVGKYIVCGEAFTKGTVFQANCVEALVEKHSTKQLQGGVVCVIAIALLVVLAVIIYAIYHRVVIYKMEQKS